MLDKLLFPWLVFLLFQVDTSEPRLHHEYVTPRKGTRRSSYNVCSSCFCFDDNNYPNSRRKVLQQVIRQALIVGSSSCCCSTAAATARAIVAVDDGHLNAVQSNNSDKHNNVNININISSSSISNQNERFIPRKPFAPPPALVPAARVKYVMEESLRLLDELESIQSKKDSSLSDRNDDGYHRHYNNHHHHDDDDEKVLVNDIVGNLQKLILVKTFMSPLYSSQQDETTTGSTVWSQIRRPEAKKKELANNNNDMDPLKSKIYQDSYNEKLKSVSPINIPYALLVKAGDIRQLKQLQARQEKLERLNPVREAFNYYTRQLQFDTEYYLLNVSAQEKKKMIRNDELPDIKSVIVSDLDLRDLVRNQVLDAYDDVKYELKYQVTKYNEKGLEFDGSGDLKSALLKAKKECDEWFSFISDEDVKEAMDTVMNEGGDERR
jgi:hypothetical protein